MLLNFGKAKSIKTAAQAFTFAVLIALCFATSFARDDVKFSGILQAKKPAIIDFEVRAVIYSGDEDEYAEPVTHAKFYLLDRDAIEVLKELKLQPVFEGADDDNIKNGKSTIKAENLNNYLDNEEAFLEAAVRVIVSENNDKFDDISILSSLGFNDFSNTNKTESDAENALLYILIQDRLKNYTKAEFSLNSEGTGKAERIKSGNYFLFGYGWCDGEIVVWNLPVVIEFSNLVLEIDQHNSGALFTY
jgi:hypothetical protein